MNIRFLAQSEYFNGIHIKDDIILEKEYEQGRFTNLPRVRYYLVLSGRERKKGGYASF
ncbi:MAG: hypothetical protein ACLR1A_07525 [Eubacterium ventriosum]